ncbi:NEDD8 ultimate buster 1-like [Trichomycterus rosablanca]|uniref:NEDD8 ultimate buster 1-like n=1 Tax=Trichomycterus rosablanca TaxID=2290929 RepID=UPI002F351CAB
MAEEHIQAKLVTLLKQDKIQLWKSPFTTDSNEAGHEHMQELAVRYSPAVRFPQPDVEFALEEIRCQTCSETNTATLKLMLSKEIKRDFETKLDITAEELMNKIKEKFNLKHIQLILKGKVLSPDKRLYEQNVKNKSKIMVQKLSDPEDNRMMIEKEEKKRCNEGTRKRTLKGFQILSEIDGGEDSLTTPYLEIADQKGNPIHIPLHERKALILAMGFHEKGRALMKRKEYETALSYLRSADEQFSICGFVLLNTVDNYAVLQLDIVWCHRAQEALKCLEECKQRLHKAEDCFLKCYGEEKKRLQQIKGTTGGEEVLFLRLYLLQSLLAYWEGNETQAANKLQKVEELCSHLRVDPEKMTQLTSMGFSEQDARLSLRACRGNVDGAVQHIQRRRNEQEKSRLHLEAISTLVELGYKRSAAAKALHMSSGDLNDAYRYLLSEAGSYDTSQPDSDRQINVEQMTYQGFQREEAEAALSLVGDDVRQATELLMENQGVIPPELRPPSSSDEPSTSSEDSASGSSSLDAELVNEVLEDIPRHEEDYLDVTLEEEEELIALMKSYLQKSSACSS